MANRASEFLSDSLRDSLLDRYDRNQERLRDYREGRGGGFEDVGSATADRQAKALEDWYDQGDQNHDWYDQLRRERDEDRARQAEQAKLNHPDGLGQRPPGAPDFRPAATAQSLKGAEADALKNKNDKGKDIAGLENSRGKGLYNNANNVKFPYDNNKNQKVKVKGGLKSKLKLLLPVGLPMVVIGGIVAVFMIVIAPFMQMGDIFENNIGFFAGAVVKGRLTAVARSLSNHIGKLSVGGLSLESTEIGRFVAKSGSMVDELKSQGISFDPDGKLKIDISADNGLTNYSGSNARATTGGRMQLRGATTEEIAKSLGVSPDKISLGATSSIPGGSVNSVQRIATVDIKNLSNSEKMIFQNNLILKTRAGPIAKKIASMKLRLASTKPLAKLMDFHPIKKRVSIIKEKTTDRLGKLLFQAINGKKIADLGEKAYQQAIKEAMKDSPEGLEPNDTAKKLAEKAKKKAITDATASANQGVVKGTIRNMLKKVFKPSTIEKMSTVLKNATGVKLGYASLIEEIVSLLCMLWGIEDNIGQDMWVNVAMPAMAHFGEIIAIRDEMKANFIGYDNVKAPANDDCTVGETVPYKYKEGEKEITDGEGTCENIEPMEQMQVASKRFVCSDVQLVDINANGGMGDGGVSDYSSVGDTYDADPNDAVNNTEVTVDGTHLNYTPTEDTKTDCYNQSAISQMVTGGGAASAAQIADTVPYSLTMVGSTSARSTLESKIGTTGQLVGTLINGVYTVVKKVPRFEGLCALMNSLLGGILTSLLAGVIDAVLGAITGGAYTGIAGTTATIAGIALAGLFTGIGMLATGEPLTVEQSTPASQSTSIADTGAAIADKVTCASTSGCLNMPNADAQLVWNDQQQYLAMEWEQKPLLAKIFDGGDYRSVISTIGNVANLDPTGKGPAAFFANFARLFGSIPKLFGTAVNSVSGVTHAASSELFGGYDFGFDVSGYTQYEMSEMYDLKYDPIENAQYIKNNPSIIAANAPTLKTCFLSEIDPVTLKVTILDNSKGDIYNLQKADGECSASKLALKPALLADNDTGTVATADANEDLYRLRLFLGDSSIMKSESCSSTEGMAGGDCEGIFPGASSSAAASSTGLVAGGMSESQAEAFIQPYKNLTESASATVPISVGCSGKLIWNCVSFSQWFVNSYTDVTWTNTTNGKDVVTRLHDTYGWEVGTEPRPYSVFSLKYSESDIYGHTGVVLGVNEDGSFVIGEASCGGCIRRKTTDEAWECVNRPYNFNVLASEHDADIMNRAIKASTVRLGNHDGELGGISVKFVYIPEDRLKMPANNQGATE